MAKTTRRAMASAIVLGLALLPWFPAQGATPKTKRVSVRSNGNQGNDHSANPSVSASGRFVAFSSKATNLVPGDANDTDDVFVHDRKTKKTKRVSVRSNGNEAGGQSLDPSISADGRLVAFSSSATNLVPGDDNAARDIFVHNRKSGKTNRVNVRSNGDEAVGGEISFPGGSFSFGSSAPSISANGRFVAFVSVATNLVGGDDNGDDDVFVHDRKTGKTNRVSVRSNGDEAEGRSFSPSISGNGRFVAFRSAADNLVGGDTNGSDDVFVHNKKTGKTNRVSVRSNGAQGNGSSGFDTSISADGRFVAFSSQATNLVAGDDNGDGDIFVHNRNSGKTKRVSVRSNGAQAEGEEGSTGSSSPSISGNGRFVAFRSDAINLVAGDTNGQTDIFVHDRKTGKTKRASVHSNGNEAEGSSSLPSISADGRLIAFESIADNLVPGDTNTFVDIFVRGPLR